MKFRHLEKVKVKSGYYRNYKGVVMGVSEGIESSKENIIQYTVKLTITKDPLVIETKSFFETELSRRMF
jgi:hypothetical protein